MSEEDFKKIDNAEIKYKYVEKNPIKLFKRKIDFNNCDLLTAVNVFAFMLILLYGVLK